MSSTVIVQKGLAMRSFVDKVKAGKWANVMSAVASLGAAATSVGVSAGVAAAEPLAKDLARGLEELTGSVDVRERGVSGCQFLYVLS